MKLNYSQIGLIVTAAAATLVIYFFGPTNAPVTGKKEVHQHAETEFPAIGFPEMLDSAKKRLSPLLLKRVDSIEKQIDLTSDQGVKKNLYTGLARLWMDSVGAFVPFAKYTSEAAKLENSEKSITFAAQLLLEQALSINIKPLQKWMAQEARDLFERALQLNPSNDSLKISLGGCYFFGAAKDGEPPMQGIMMIREVAERQPKNAYAQWMLGVGSLESGQWEKAADRFKQVVELEPENLDAQLKLAYAFEKSGKKQEAADQYRELLRLVKRLEKEKKFQPPADMISQMEEQIKTLEK